MKMLKVFNKQTVHLKYIKRHKKRKKKHFNHQTIPITNINIQFMQGKPIVEAG